MSDLWIAYEAAARGIARERRGEGKDPTPTERILARVALDAALPHLPGPDPSPPPPSGSGERGT